METKYVKSAAGLEQYIEYKGACWRTKLVRMDGKMYVYRLRWYSRLGGLS